MAPKRNSDQRSPSPVMNVAELCGYLKLHRSAVYRLIRAGKIPYFRISSDYRFNREDINEWRKRQEAKPT